MLVSEERRGKRSISHLSFQAQLQEKLTRYTGGVGWIPRKCTLRLSLVYKKYP